MVARHVQGHQSLRRRIPNETRSERVAAQSDAAAIQAHAVVLKAPPRRFGLGCLVELGVSYFLVLPAQAESKAPSAAPPASAVPMPSAPAPDIVRMKDGGMLRGTIAESKPGEFVTIVLITGESRKVAAADISYAGPVDAAPAQIRR